MKNTCTCELEDKDQFIIAYFNQVRGEIRERVQIHSTLLLQKIVTCGAALGFLITQEDQDLLLPKDALLLGFALIPIVAMMYDVMMARNINNLHRLGRFIRNELESLVPSMQFRLWETKYGQPDNSMPTNHGPLEVLTLTVFTLATELIAGYIYFKTNPFLLLLLILPLIFIHSYVHRYVSRQITTFDIFKENKSKNLSR